MRSFRFALTPLAALATLGAARPLAAQMIHGRLLQDGTLVPLTGASVQLMDARGNEMNRLVVTNEAGTFAMTIRLATERITAKRSLELGRTARGPDQRDDEPPRQERGPAVRTGKRLDARGVVAS